RILMESREQFRAERAVVTTSEFGEPHFAIGARRVTLTEIPPRGVAQGQPIPADQSVTRYRWTAERASVEVGDVSVPFWPRLTGTTDPIPLRSVDVGYSQNKGFL